MILNKNVFELQLIDEVSGDLLWVIPPQQTTGLKFNKLMSGVGNITITLPYNETLWNLYHDDIIIEVYTLINSTDTMNKEETYFLVGRETYYENNIPQMVFFGHSLDGLVLRRYMKPTNDDNTNAGGFVTRAGLTGDVLEQIFQEQLTNTDDAQRTFSNLTINKIDSGAVTVGFRTRYTPLIETLDLIKTREERINWKFRRSTTKNIVIDIGYLADDYRYDEIYPDTGFLVFSPDYGNISNPVFKSSSQNKKTVVYVQGEGEGVNQQLLQLSTPNVFDSIYSWIETTVKSTKGEGSKQTAFQQALDVGLKEIHETKKEETFSFQIIEGFHGYEYRTNFDIGDLISFYWRNTLVNFKIKSTTFTVNNNNVVREFELELEID